MMMNRLEQKGRRPALRVYLLAAFALTLVFAFSDSTQAQWATNGNNINTTNTGNVGIGTTTPNAKLVIANGNVGLGTNNIANWSGATSALESLNTSIFFGLATDLHLLSNVYNDAGGWKYKTTNPASNFYLYNGIASWRVAPAGTANTAVTWINAMTLDNSGRLGIGTTSPVTPLHVLSNNGNILMGNIAANYGAIGFQSTLTVNNFALTGSAAETVLNTPTGTSLSLRVNNNPTNALVLNSSGNVGIGTTSPSSKLELNGGSGAGSSSLLRLSRDNANGFGTTDFKQFYTSGSDYGLRIGNTVNDWFTLNGSNGYVGIGTPSPSVKLDVNGNTNVTGDFNATGTITGGTIVAKYQDVAEWVPATHALPAGTVVVLNPAHSNQVMASGKSYDTGVAGVVSERPGLSLGEASADKVLVATTGRVKVKVDATRAPIKVGDLLVTSEKEGVAMKSEPLDLGGTPIHRPGTLIGKALEPLEEGTGEILVLLSLQ